MGLCLTYLVNCGMSTRATSRVMREVHGIKISHTQIAKYATTASFCIKPFVDSFDYKPTNFLAADETYTKVKGVKHYVWFVMDAIKKSILGYQASNSRDTGSCILAMRMAFDKFKQFPAKALKFIADGFSAYKLAQQQFALHGFDFDVTQVFGLTNDDPVSAEYRWLQQIIDLMALLFNAGDIAIIQRTDKLISGKTYLIKYKNTYIIRRIIDLENELELNAMNPYYPPIRTLEIAITIIGQVIRAENQSAF